MKNVTSKRPNSETTPTELLLMLTVPPVIMGLAVSQFLLTELRVLGEASQEVFRGDRLPLVPLDLSDQTG